MQTKRFHRGDRVVVSGQGRTASWHRMSGTVTTVLGRSILVSWDESAFASDEMLAVEIVKAAE